MKLGLCQDLVKVLEHRGLINLKLCIDDAGLLCFRGYVNVCSELAALRGSSLWGMLVV